MQIHTFFSDFNVARWDKWLENILYLSVLFYCAYLYTYRVFD